MVDRDTALDGADTDGSHYYSIRDDGTVSPVKQNVNSRLLQGVSEPKLLVFRNYTSVEPHTLAANRTHE